MSSALLNLYDDLAGMSVTFTDQNDRTKTITAKNLDAIPGSLQTSELPCRVLLPVGFDRPAEITTQKGGLVARWGITDLFLLDTLAQGQGVKNYAEPLMSYMSAYASAINILWRFPKASARTSEELELISVTITPGPQEYPVQSGAFFYGARCTLTIEELFF